MAKKAPDSKNAKKKTQKKRKKKRKKKNLFLLFGFVIFFYVPVLYTILHVIFAFIYRLPVHVRRNGSFNIPVCPFPRHSSDHR